MAQPAFEGPCSVGAARTLGRPPRRWQSMHGACLPLAWWCAGIPSPFIDSSQCMCKRQTGVSGSFLPKCSPSDGSQHPSPLFPPAEARVSGELGDEGWCCPAAGAGTPRHDWCVSAEVFTNPPSGKTCLVWSWSFTENPQEIKQDSQALPRDGISFCQQWRQPLFYGFQYLPLFPLQYSFYLK